MKRNKPLTERDFYRRRRPAPKVGRWWEKIAAWQKTEAGKQFERDLLTIKH